MNIFDTHSDTPFDMYRQGLSLDNGTTRVSLSRVKDFEKKFFVSAFYSDNKKEPQECYEEFLESSAYYDRQIEQFSSQAMLCRNRAELEECFNSGRFGAIKAIEGAKLVCSELDRVDVLYDHGVRHILPVWKGSDFIGGAWNTEDGLTGFGKAFVKRCEEKGIIVDVSHMSLKSFWDTAESVDCPIIASHSNYYSVNRHPRNLRDDQVAEIISRGGIIGLNLCLPHVELKYDSVKISESDDFVGEVARHAYYCLEKGGEKNICLGCDWDGTTMSPQIRDVSMIGVLYDRMLADGISESTVQDIFFNNAYNFYVNNLK